MSAAKSHRRTVKHYHEPGDLHELTFSCYRRLPLLTNDAWRCLLADAVDRACAGRGFPLVAFVFMPEHVHLVVYPRSGVADAKDVEALLGAVKRPYSYRVKQILIESESPLLAKLTVPDKRRGTVFRYWQKGPGYDRNLSGEAAVLSSIDYIHNNPVSRGLCPEATDWKWSSARWYTSDRRVVDEDLPKIDGLPPEFF
ncbi:MAG: transposase [Planctomycetota bacterium]